MFVVEAGYGTNKAIGDLDGLLQKLFNEVSVEQPYIVWPAVFLNGLVCQSWTNTSVL